MGEQLSIIGAWVLACQQIAKKQKSKEKKF